MTHAMVHRHMRRTKKGKVTIVKQHLRKVKEYIKGGKAHGKPDKKYNPIQLAMGRKVEMEHTDDPAIANEIAKDHLEEFPNYYSELAKMEKGLEKQKGKKAKKNFGMGVYLFKDNDEKIDEDDDNIETANLAKIESFSEKVTPESKIALLSKNKDSGSAKDMTKAILGAKEGDVFNETYFFSPNYEDTYASKSRDVHSELTAVDVVPFHKDAREKFESKMDKKYLNEGNAMKISLVGSEEKKAKQEKGRSILE